MLVRQGFKYCAYLLQQLFMSYNILEMYAALDTLKTL